MSRTESSYPFLSCLLVFACACATTDSSASIDERLNSEAEVEVPIGSTLEVRADTRIQPGEYLRPALGEAGQRGVILLDGARNLTLDLRGMTLRGAPQACDPDAGRGNGLVLRNCEGVRVLGGNFSGYRVAVRLEGCDDVVLDGLTIDPAFGNRLVGSDALPHPNDQLQVEAKRAERWLESYGAAIAVVDSSRVEVRNSRATGGQNGLIALRSEGCRFIENDFSYLSGWGIALSHSDKNLIAGNRCDVVTRRGSSIRSEPDHGATGILLAGGSSDNIIASNSARRSTAGGRELYLENEIGQRNRWFANDFSGATCVSMELEGAHDSWVFGNLFHDVQGVAVRARHSERLTIANNEISNILGAGIELHGGRHLVVHGNKLLECDSALEVTSGDLLGGELQQVFVDQNQFAGNIQDLVLDRCIGIEFARNDFEVHSAAPHLDGLTADGESELAPREVWAWLADAEGDLPSGRGVHSALRRSSGNLQPVLRRIADWKAPEPFAQLPRALALANEASGLGERAPRATMGFFGPWNPNGGRARAHADLERELLGGARWQATWFQWSAGSDPRGELESWRARRFHPLGRAEVDGWREPWGSNDDIRAVLPNTQFGLIASVTFELSQPAKYLLGVVSDDGVRLALDGTVVIEDWTWHAAKQYSREVELDAGRHTLTLEYFQIDGPAVLTLEIAEPPGS